MLRVCIRKLRSCRYAPLCSVTNRNQKPKFVYWGLTWKNKNVRRLRRTEWTIFLLIIATVIVRRIPQPIAVLGDRYPTVLCTSGETRAFNTSVRRKNSSAFIFFYFFLIPIRIRDDEDSPSRAEAAVPSTRDKSFNNALCYKNDN